MIFGLAFIALLLTGSFGMIKCLTIKGELEQALKEAKLTGQEFYSSVPLQINLYRDSASKGITSEKQGVIKSYVHAEVLSVAAFSCIVILLALVK
ncbi:hypothetical protein FXN65_24695 [Metapseudomonas lalkuanensis]|uniref:Uncharacterized protein n=1 Tax=Metapseudomonas lalkuanensis TaxID=2604832 RepID=A0A5J6QUV1_9GAMM|nr:hypothetical protein [Pseudomonas lalkuanensis]QEY65101.1 hypothetical protein FXN65_24695 [Pseudomonas lalkuanensis]